ncbi:MAG: SDR family NAD(P)-dependent oxidoreductase [Robiginitalea sp.]|nr:SDR family NAD(P)-dependent oxidoreductase [Robiginitalea sp.]
MNKRIGILGCGWLGTPLATSLLEKGYEVRGTTTRDNKRPELEELGVHSYQIYLSETGVQGPLGSFLKGLNSLVVDIPPGLRNQPDADFVSRIRHLEQALQVAGISRLLYVSSTSVFGSVQGTVTEDTIPEPESTSGRQLLGAERLLLSNTSRQTVVLRLGGLLGPDRHPVFHLSGREIPSGGNMAVNLIRLGDALGALQYLISDPGASGVYHGVYPEYPSRREYYSAEARILKTAPPHFMDTPRPVTGKQVRPERLLQAGFRFLHPIVSADEKNHQYPG